MTVQDGTGVHCPDPWLKIHRWSLLPTTDGTMLLQGPLFEPKDGKISIDLAEDGSALPHGMWRAEVDLASGTVQASTLTQGSTTVVSPEVLSKLTGYDFTVFVSSKPTPPEPAPAPEPEPVAVVPPPPPPPPPPPAPQPEKPLVKPDGMTQAQWAIEVHWQQGDRAFKKGDMRSAREAWTKCVELDDTRADCSSGIMRTFGP